MSGSLKKASYFPSLPLFKGLFLLSRVMGTGSRFRKSELPAQGHRDCLTIISFSVLILSYNLLVCFSKIKLSRKRVNWALRAGPGWGQASSRLGCWLGCVCVSVWNCSGCRATWAARSQGCSWPRVGLQGTDLRKWNQAARGDRVQALPSGCVLQMSKGKEKKLPDTSKKINRLECFGFLKIDFIFFSVQLGRLEN